MRSFGDPQHFAIGVAAGINVGWLGFGSIKLLVGLARTVAQKWIDGDKDDLPTPCWRWTCRTKKTDWREKGPA